MKTFDQLLDEVIEEVWAEEYQTVLRTAMEVRLWTEDLSKEGGIGNHMMLWDIVRSPQVNCIVDSQRQGSKRSNLPCG